MEEQYFEVVHHEMIGAFVGGKPIACPDASGDVIMLYAYVGAQVVFEANVEVQYDPGGHYNRLAWYGQGYSEETGTVVYVKKDTSIPPDPLAFPVPGLFQREPLPPPVSVDVWACWPGRDPPEPECQALCGSGIDPAEYCEPRLAPPTRYLQGGEWTCECTGGGVPPPPQPEEPVAFGRVTGLAPGADPSGRAVVFFIMPVAPADDPNAIWTAFTYIQGFGWTFSGLPGDLTVSTDGQTREDPPRDHWGASVPTASGGSPRRYHSDASDGEFVPEIGYGTVFGPSAPSYAERIGPVLVQYDENKRIQKIAGQGAVHTYSYPSDDVVWIEANTFPLPSKMRLDLTVWGKGKPDRVTSYVQYPEWGWVAVGSASIGWSGYNLISQITLSPSGQTTYFTYLDDGTLASFEVCTGGTWTLQYAAEEE